MLALLIFEDLLKAFKDDDHATLMTAIV